MLGFPRGRRYTPRPADNKPNLRANHPSAAGLACSLAIALNRPLQRDIVKRVALIGEPGKGPVLGNRELDDGAVRAIGAQIRVEVSKVVEHEIATGFHLRGRGKGVAGRARVGMIGVDIDPVEVPIGETCQHLVGLAGMLSDAGIGGHGRIEQRKIEVDEVQFGGVTVRQDVSGKVALVGSDLGDTPTRRQGLHQVIARGRKAAVPRQMTREGRGGLAFDEGMAAKP
jgi:hypothetical protein